MSVASSKTVKWQYIAGVGLICGLVLTGCNRSDNNENAADAEPAVVDNSAVAPAVSCDDPLVQDRLKIALKDTLNQQAQILAANYANSAEVSIDSNVVRDKVGTILIDVQNAAVLQEANANGMTTCQASVSMTLPSEDLYQASEVQAANNLPSLQTRLAEDNIRINNNMLVDDAFSYVVGAKDGQVQARIAGQPALTTIVADVMAGSAFKMVLDVQQAQRQAQADARRRAAAEQQRERQAERQPARITPPKPVQPTQPVKPATITQNTEQSSSVPSTATPTPSDKAPAAVPKDDTIDMVIIEDDSATY